MSKTVGTMAEYLSNASSSLCDGIGGGGIGGVTGAITTAFSLAPVSPRAPLALTTRVPTVGRSHHDSFDRSPQMRARDSTPLPRPDRALKRRR